MNSKPSFDPGPLTGRAALVRGREKNRAQAFLAEISHINSIVV
jgi:hypothetical protein